RPEQDDNIVGLRLATCRSRFLATPQLVGRLACSTDARWTTRAPRALVRRLRTTGRRQRGAQTTGDRRGRNRLRRPEPGIGHDHCQRGVEPDDDDTVELLDALDTAAI